MTAAEATTPIGTARGSRARSDLQRELKSLDSLADLMDSRFRLPGTNIRFGLDAVVGLLPFLGDGVVTLPALYILARAHRMGAPTSLLIRMGINVALDFLIGAIPLIGDILDVGYRANRRNVALLREHFAKHPAH